MPTHSETKILPYTPDQMFDLVSDIAKYPEFLPFCTGARIIRREKEALLAELTIGYKLIKERFVSRVILDNENKAIHVGYISGPMKALQNEWHFHKEGKRKCRVDFCVHFEFSNSLLAAMTNMFFDAVFVRMVLAFEKRAAEIYG